MFGEQRTRTLLGPADPAKDTAVSPLRLSARDLIVHAEATAEPVADRRRALPTRRLVLTAGAVAVAVGAASVINQVGGGTVADPKATHPSGAEAGTVLVPIAYQFETEAPPAGPHLRALADKLVDAPYENHIGRYAYHHTKMWNKAIVMTPDGYFMGFSVEKKEWRAADQTGWQTTVQVTPEYPDQQSRDYFASRPKVSPTGTPAPPTIPMPPDNYPPLPSDRSGLATRLGVRDGADTVCRHLGGGVYSQYVVPRQTRAEILRIIADVPGFVWRGEVTDRVGRHGVAITYDDRAHDQQHLLIFNPKTGDLLANEVLILTPKRISSYQVILHTDRTNQLN